MILVCPRVTEQLHVTRGPHMVEGVLREWAQSSRWGAQSEDLWASAFIGVMRGNTDQRPRGFHFIVVFECTRSQSGEAKGNWWQGSALSHWCPWSSGQDSHSRFVGILRQENYMRV